MLSITGSSVRAAVIAQLFGDDPRPRSIGDLARITRLNYAAVRRELLRLVRDGVVRHVEAERKLGPLYEGDPAFAGHLELRRFALVTTGRPARIREAIGAVDGRALAWLYGAGVETASYLRVLPVAVITREPRRMRVSLGALGTDPGQRLTLDAMSLDEWTVRLERREMRVLAIRRAQRLWLLGDGAALRRAEHFAIASRRTEREAIKNWRQELSDDWDEDFDPFAPS